MLALGSVIFKGAAGPASPLVVSCASCGHVCLGGDLWVALPVMPMGQQLRVLCPECSREMADGYRENPAWLADLVPDVD